MKGHCSLVGVAFTVLMTAATAAAHPGTPYRTAAWAKSRIFEPGKGEFADRSARCIGVGPSRNRAFRHFRCLVIQNDGSRFSEVLHTRRGSDPDHDWDFSDVRYLGGGGPGYRIRVIGRQSARGDFATASASGSINAPVKIEVQIIASPDQLVEVEWTMVCARGTGAGSRSGRFRDYSRMSRSIPFPTRNPDDCTVSAVASLSRTGAVTVKIYGFR